MPIEFQNIDWGWLVAIAGAMGAIALGWSRIMELIDTWLIKTILPGHRGYIIVFGNAVQYWWPRRGWRLLILCPFIYPQVFLLAKVESFSIKVKPMDSNEQTVRNTYGGRIYRVVGKATVQYARDGRLAKLSQIQVENPEGVFHQLMQGVVADVVSQANPNKFSSYEQLNKQIVEGCRKFEEVCGIRIISFRISTLAPVEAQIVRDGIETITLPG